MKMKKRIKLKNKNILYIILIILAIIISLLLIFFYVNKKDKPIDEKPYINISEFNISNNASLFDVPEYKSLNQKDIIGNWKAVSKMTFEGKVPIENSTISFNKDFTYTLNNEGFVKTGRYKIDGYTIYLYKSNEDLKHLDELEYIYLAIEDSQLIITFPKIPKVIYYEKS